MTIRPSDKASSKEQLALLESIAKDAVHKAADATARLLGIQLPMNAVSVSGVPVSEIQDAGDDPEAITVAIYVAVEGNVPGHAAFICPEAQALVLVDLLLGQPSGTTAFLDELGASALQELGNILTSSYLTSFSEHTGWAFLPSPPQLAVDMASALVSTILVGSAEGSPEAITMVTEFLSDESPLRGRFLYIPYAGAVPMLLQRLREAA